MIHPRSIAFVFAIAALAACKGLSHEPTAPLADSAEAKKDEPADADALLRKEHELEYARVQSKLAGMDARLAARASRNAIEAAERELAAAKSEHDHFVGVVTAFEIAERTLAVDRAAQGVVESEQELGELEAMYKAEQFAGMTKELVLTRGRSHLAMAKRELELARGRMEQLQAFEHPKRRRELGDAVTKADVALADARAQGEKGVIEQQLAVQKAEHAIGDLEREVVKLRAAPAPKP